MIVEIRIVVSRININYFDDIVELISRRMKKVAYVSVIAMEMTGSAHDNADKLWIPYSRLFNQISAGIMKMIESGIDVRLYNFPLCTVDRRYWAICEKSISTNKRKYADICEQCKEKDACGGVFTGSFRYELGDLRVIR